MASMHITLAAAVVLLVWASDCTAEHQETFTVQYKDGMREQVGTAESVLHVLTTKQ